MTGWSVIFDLGGVVLGWDPVRAYAQVLPADQIAAFLTKIDFFDWNYRNDAGRAFEVGEQLLIEQFPDEAVAIQAYRTHFPQALTGMVEGTSAVIAELAQAGVRLIGLTNWSAETFPHALERFGILDRLEGIVVSGTELVAKPDPAIFQLTCERYGLEPTRTVFIDDSPPNVAAARRLGISGITFTDAGRLRAELVTLGLLGERLAVTEPVFHLAIRAAWAEAQRSGDFGWSSRDVSYEREGYVHLSFASQVAGVRARFYGDVASADLVLLELDPSRLDAPLIVEDLGAGEAYPHLYASLPPAAVVAVHDLD